MKNEYKLVRDKELYFLEDSHDLFEKDQANGDVQVQKERFESGNQIEVCKLMKVMRFR